MRTHPSSVRLTPPRPLLDAPTSLTILSFQRANKNKEEKMKLSSATHALLLLFFFTVNAAEMKDENLPDAAQHDQVRGYLRKAPNYDAIVDVGTEEVCKSIAFHADCDLLPMTVMTNESIICSAFILSGCRLRTNRLLKVRSSSWSALYVTNM